MVTITIPAPSSMLLVNLLGLLGLLGLAVTVGGLAGNWLWGLGVLSVEAIFLSVVAATKLDPGERVEQAEAPTGTLSRAA